VAYRSRATKDGRRYGGDGAVRVTIDTLDDCCRISVEDQGSGIDLDHEAAALRPFGRLHPEDPGHVGLGLNICQRSLTLIRATMSFRRSSDGFAVEVRLEP
jgi:signal transduction histidine kinase